MTPMAEARGFSVQRPSYCWDSLKALPEPLDILCCVLIAVQDEPTRGANMGPHGETLLHPFPTAATLLAGVCRWNRYHSLAGACCLAGEDLTEVVPPSILN